MGFLRTSSCKRWTARSLLLIWAFFFCFSFADEFGVFPKVDEKADQAIEAIFGRPAIAPSPDGHVAKVFQGFFHFIEPAVLTTAVTERFLISPSALQRHHPPPGGQRSFRMTSRYLM